MTPRMKPRHSLAALMQENAKLKKQVTYESFMSEAKDEIQREWVNTRIKEINTTIRSSGNKKK